MLDPQIISAAAGAILSIILGVLGFLRSSKLDNAQTKTSSKELELFIEMSDKLKLVTVERNTISLQLAKVTAEVEELRKNVNKIVDTPPTGGTPNGK